MKIDDQFVVSRGCAESVFAPEIETEQCAELVGWKAEPLLKASPTMFVPDSTWRKRLECRRITARRWVEVVHGYGETFLGPSARLSVGRRSLARTSFLLPECLRGETFISVNVEQRTTFDDGPPADIQGSSRCGSRI